MINSQKQTGSALVVIIIFFVVVILGVLGYVVWNNYFASKDNNTQQVDTKSDIKNESSNENPNDGYFEIDEWGLKFKINESLESTNITHGPGTAKDSLSHNYLTFSTTRIQALGGKCTQEPFGDTVILNRLLEKPITTPDGQMISDEALGGYYYVLSSPVASCSGFNENGEMKSPSQIEVDDRAGLRESIRTLEFLE